MKKHFCLTALCLGLLMTAAHAQSVLPKLSDGGGKGVDTQKIYDVVEQMPTLPDGGSTYAIGKAIQQALVLPAGAKADTKVLVEFIVDRSGKVRDARVLETPSPEVGKAVLVAVAKLPQLKPGKQNGQATNVRLRVPVIPIAQP